MGRPAATSPRPPGEILDRVAELGLGLRVAEPCQRHAAAERGLGLVIAVVRRLTGWP
jgi:hypothetical protein